MAASQPLVLARHFLRLRQFDRVLDVLEKVTSAELQDVDAWRLRAAALHGLRRYDEAVQAAEQGLARCADDVGLLDQLALSASARGKRREGLAALRLAQALAPDDPLLLAHEALLLSRPGRTVVTRRWRLRTALGRAEQAARLAPESLQVLRIRALVAAQAGDPRASAYKQQLLAADPADPNARLVSAAVSARGREVDEALAHYLKAARLDPADQRTAWVGRRSRALMHPAAAPLRLLWRLGALRVQLAVIVLSFALLTVHATTARAVLLAVWLALVLYVVAFRVGLRLRFGRRPR